MRRSLWFASALLASGLAPAAEAGQFENEVRARWRGAWVVLQSESYSDCAGGYHSNKVSGGYVTSAGSRRFAPGELGKVHKVQVRRARVELYVALDVPVLLPYQDGPFTLYQERSCGVELSVRVPKPVLKAKDVGAVDRLLAPLAARHETREEAYASAGWNGREREPYPEDYDLTLARHAAWQAEQTNLAIDARLALALDAAQTTTTTIDDDPEYLQGFVAGVDTMKRWRAGGCGQLLDQRFEVVRRRPPEERRAEGERHEAWRAGFEDGQRLVYSLAILDRLDDCYVPVPRLPGDESTDGVAALR